jgi:cytochrome c oxidase subunit 2
MRQTAQPRGPRRTSGGLHRIAAAAALAWLLSSCAAETSILSPAGPAAARIAELWWLMFGLAAAIFAGVTGLLLLALFRRRSPGRRADARMFIVGGGIALPLVTLAVLFTLTLSTMNALAARETALTVRVTGWQWWWEVYYPEGAFYTANEIHIPVGQPVRFELDSGDVIHNFWVPELHGKFDLIPGRPQTIWLQADRPGVYRGMCAEYCGEQHAKMRFVIVAVPPEEFAAWAARQKQPAAQPSDPTLLRGQQVFLGSACVYCHAVGGTNASSRFGPDLTHLASRRTLAAGVLENNRGNLAGWILNPQTIKPGNKMPPVVLASEDLQALLAYLESLE